ncbi:MAG: acyltransferase [Clostridia bacterium]|nr:acyltransferase [Clostridia bacterium]
MTHTMPKDKPIEKMLPDAAQMPQKSERNMGVELFRVVAMLLVVCLHILGRGGVVSSTDYLSANYKLAHFLQVITYCSVNCYALISGFANVKTEFKFRRFFFLWLETVFLITATNAVVYFFVPSVNFKPDWWIAGIFPLIKRELWYLCAYFFMYPLLPMLNKGMLALKQWQHAAAMLMLQAPIIFRLIEGTDNYVLGGGYSAIWLICLYVMGAYFRIYGAPKWAKWFVTLPIFFLSALVAWAMKIIPETLLRKGMIEESSEWYASRGALISYISPCMVIMAVMLLLFFMQIKVKHKVPKLLIAHLGRSTWGVFVIHVAAAFWYFWDFWNSFRKFGDYSTLGMLFSVLGSAVLVYLVLSLFSIGREYLFKLCRVQKGVDLLIALPGKLLAKYRVHSKQ